jgi:hypothetical protein
MAAGVSESVAGLDSGVKMIEDKNATFSGLCSITAMLGISVGGIPVSPCLLMSGEPVLDLEPESGIVPCPESVLDTGVCDSTLQVVRRNALVVNGKDNTLQGETVMGRQVL